MGQVAHDASLCSYMKWETITKRFRDEYGRMANAVIAEHERRKRAKRSKPILSIKQLVANHKRAMLKWPGT